MQKYIHVLCVILAMLLLLTACGKSEQKEAPATGTSDTSEQKEVDTTDASESETAPSATQGTATTDTDEEALVDYSIRFPEAVVDIPASGEESTALTESQTIEKIATVNADNISVYEGGFVYKAENGLSGIISLDGKNDTGAKYAYCKAGEMYFTVMEESITDISDISAMNNLGLVNSRGQELIPQKYASIEVLNSRFARACEVTGTLSTKDGALVYVSASNDMFASLSGPKEGDYYFSGNWYIYDLASGTKVPGASGTHPYVATAYGNYVKYVTDDKAQYTVHGDGTPLPQGANMITGSDYGLYKYNNHLYDSQDNKLFKLNINGFTVGRDSGNYLYASKSENGNSTYILLDYEGNVISAEFSQLPEVHGNLIRIQDSETNVSNYVDFQNNLIFTDDSDNEVVFSNYMRKCFFVTTSSELKVYDINGAQIAAVYADDIRNSFYNYYKISDNYDKNYLCLKTKSFITTDADEIGPWLLKASSTNNTSLVIDAISGEVLLDGIKEVNATFTRTHTYITYTNEAGETEILQVK